jgi:hypothetical protein
MVKSEQGDLGLRGRTAGTPRGPESWYSWRIRPFGSRPRRRGMRAAGSDVPSDGRWHGGLSAGQRAASIAAQNEPRPGMPDGVDGVGSGGQAGRCGVGVVGRSCGSAATGLLVALAAAPERIRGRGCRTRSGGVVVVDHGGRQRLTGARGGQLSAGGGGRSIARNRRKNGPAAPSGHGSLGHRTGGAESRPRAGRRRASR